MLALLRLNTRDNKCPAGEAWHLSGVSTAAIIKVAKIKIHREKDTYSQATQLIQEAIIKLSH